MTFHIHALDPAPFARYFAMDSAALAGSRAVLRKATSKPGFPCRVSLVDADIDEDLVLVNYRHQAAESPYRAAHAVFVRKGAVQAHPLPGEIPEVFRTRILSLRAFDRAGMMVEAEIVSGIDLALILKRLVTAPTVDEVHIHFAGPGCFAARATRATA